MHNQMIVSDVTLINFSGPTFIFMELIDQTNILYAMRCSVAARDIRNTKETSSREIFDF